MTPPFGVLARPATSIDLCIGGTSAQLRDEAMFNCSMVVAAPQKSTNEKPFRDAD